MPIEFRCDQCNTLLRTPDDTAGKQAKCPSCGAILPVPMRPTAPQAAEVERPSTFNEIGPTGQRDAEDSYESLQEAHGQPSGVPRYVPSYLAQAILCTLFCCLPFGIVAIVFAAQVNGHLAAGNYQAALSASENARTWCWISFWLGIIPIGLWFLFMLGTIGAGL